MEKVLCWKVALKKKSMNKPEHIHALKYATEATKIYLMDEYKRKYPHYFQNVVFETRPATANDYFVPPSIAKQCKVVVKTKLDQIGCKRIGCFPFKNNAEICEENDPVQWIRVGNRYELACQQSCKDHSIDTDWTADGRCILSNPLKKKVATLPEKLFQRATRHVYHGGFDIVNGDLKLNRRYCDAYGLEFINEDCVSTEAQTFGEWIIGKTATRAITTTNIPVFTFQPPPVPNFMKYKVTKRRIKRSLSDIEEDSVDNSAQFRELAVEISVDLGREISEYAIEKLLKKSAPKLVSKAISNISVKLGLKHAVAMSLKNVALSSVKTMGTVVGVVTAVYTLYEMTVGILDAIDPFDYTKFFDKKKLNEINKELDYSYYEEGPFRPEFTPEYMFDIGFLMDEEDHENQLNFMISKIEEYLTALKNIPPTEFYKATKRPWVKQIVKMENWDSTLFKCILFVMVCLTLIFYNWIHIWSCCLFFAMLLYKAY